MDKKLRKELSDQIAVAIAFLLKGKHEGAANKLEKHIRSASKDLAKKFLKARKDAEENLVGTVKAAAKKTAAKKSVPKAATKSTAKTPKGTPVKVKKVRRVPRKGK